MSNQEAIKKQAAAVDEGRAAHQAGQPLEANPHPVPQPFEDPHQGPLRAAWENGWLQADRLTNIYADTTPQALLGPASIQVSYKPVRRSGE